MNYQVYGDELYHHGILGQKPAISKYENNSRGVSAEMLTQLSRLFHVSTDYILNGDTPDNLDSIVNEAIKILNHLKDPWYSAKGPKDLMIIL